MFIRHIMLRRPVCSKYRVIAICVQCSFRFVQTTSRRPVNNQLLNKDMSYRIFQKQLCTNCELLWWITVCTLSFCYKLSCHRQKIQHKTRNKKNKLKKTQEKLRPMLIRQIFVNCENCLSGAKCENCVNCQLS